MRATRKRLINAMLWVGFVLLIMMTVVSIHDFLVKNEMRLKTASMWSFKKADIDSLPTVQPLEPQWDISAIQTGSQKGPRTHLGFLKVHKAASTTTQAIFLRFGWRRNLTCVLPPEYNRFGYPNIISTNESVKAYNILPSPPGKQFDILAHHVIYEKKGWDSVLPKDAAIIGTVREPSSHFNSILNYFNPPIIRLINASDQIGVYLRNHKRFEVRPATRSFTNNRLAVEYGVYPEIIKNKDFDSFNRYLHDVLDKEFDVVIVAERFDESLVLMKRKLNWGLDDILYALKNVGHNPDRYLLKPADALLLKDILVFDWLLYDFFQKKLDQQILDEGPSFTAEVNHFKEVRRYIENFCHDVPQAIKSVTVDKSAWNDIFEITRFDCEVLHRGEIKFTQDIRRRQYGTATWSFRGKVA